VVIATEREQFRALDLDRLRCLMVRPVIVDLSSIYRADEMKRVNFLYRTGGGLPLSFFGNRRAAAA
jgi:UDPglucose 6-dehydrogenase